MVFFFFFFFDLSFFFVSNLEREEQYFLFATGLNQWLWWKIELFLDIKPEVRLTQ